MTALLAGLSQAHPVQARPFDVLESPLDGVNLVEASAGTGKTWNICGLYLRLLLEGRLEVREILVVTFTNAATAELRERVRARIVETLAYVRGQAPLQDAAVPGTSTSAGAAAGVLAGTPSASAADAFVPALVRRLEAQGMSQRDMAQRLHFALQGFDEAAIVTIHGFCQRALAETPFAAALPFAQEIVPDDTELRLAAVHDFWRRHIAGDGCSPALAAWLDACRVTPATLDALLARHLKKPLARVRWPADIDAPLSFDAAALDAAFAQVRDTWAQARAGVLDAVLGAQAALGRSYGARSIDQAMRDWDAWLGHDAYAPIAWKDSKLPLFTTTCLQARSNGASPRHAFFEQADALIARRKEAEAQLECARLRLVRTLLDEAGTALRACKRDARLASYDDLLRNLHEALQPPDGARLAAILRTRFPVALIDEFQDTDPVQFAIFRAIHGHGPLFLVGDPKQAIYAFRNADLHTYLQAAANVEARWTLTDNQRSTAPLIAAVNGLFGANPRAFMLAGLDYHAVREGAKPRKPLADRGGVQPGLRIWTLPRWDSGAPLARTAAFEAATRASAAEIARLLRAGGTAEITLDGAPLAPHHIAVLVRTHRQGAMIKEALAQLGVGSVELSQATVFKSVDAEEVARVLAAIVSPGDDRMLRAALATELLGLDAARIAALDADEAAASAFAQRFASYREAWQASGIAAMYRDMLRREGVAARMLARPDGERRLTNLLHLGELLHAAAQAHRTPDALLRWLDSRRGDPAQDEAAQLRLESDRNLVQIVTIHKVKGLEYPIVFCPFLWDGYRLPPGRGVEGRQYHDDRGHAVIDLRGDAELGPELDAVKERIELEACAEDLRLAYVALTRASHRCYLVAGCYGKPLKNGDAPKETRAALLNWLVAGAPCTPRQWLDGAGSAPAIDDAWANFAGAHAPDVACLPLPTEPGRALAAEQPAAGSLASLAPPSRIAEPWRIGSFSALYANAAHEGAASDHDASVTVSIAAEAAAEGGVDGALAHVATRPPRDVPGDDILRFPRGIAAGDCLHAVLEHVDFTQPRTWDDAIARALRDHPMSLPGVAAHMQQPLLARMIARMLGDVVSTELGGGIRLDAVAPSRRLTELAFNLPAHGLDAAALNAALEALGYPVARLGFARLQGYLNGYIDLMFEHAGRYYVLDWKSNHLGYTPADYAASAREAAMARHGYHLQSLLYAVAVSRYLACRVAGYRYDTHFGGVLYLFVRGVRPAWKADGGDAAGVHFHRPEAGVLARLERLLDPRAAGVQA
jgi:exodeoxyribonuclease V beta subunit